MKKLKLRFNDKQLSSFAQKILLKLQDGCNSYIIDDKKVKVGVLVAPVSAINTLLSMDLICRRGDSFYINSVGQSYIRRMKHLAKASKNNDSSLESSYCGQHRLEGKRSVSDGLNAKVYKSNLAETPLGWLLKRKNKAGKTMISQEQFLAGERLREDFEMSNLSANVTLNYDSVIRSGSGNRSQCGMNVSDHMISAKKRLDSALDSAGPGLKDILLRVCCHLEGLEAAEKNLGWPMRSGKVVLEIALSRLVCHYNNQIG